ncbi:MAG: hypothetical protein JO257_38005 [Deltaproteobacteria bacterium]|nr:hypothetical protein [Deltaproteobacteria bacterium]
MNALWGALHALGTNAEIGQIEHWGFAIHAALSAAGREFHNHDHVIDIAKHGDPLEVIAALYHDAVYIQVDQGPPRSMRTEMDRVLLQTEAGYRVLPAAAASPVTSDVLAVFDRHVGDVVTPMTGLNEFASALVASIHLEHALDRVQRIGVAACIEQTIPFREDPVTGLRERLHDLALSKGEIETILQRAVRVGNRDVENFADNDPATFLDSTWKLLPESNPALHAPMVYTVRDYRIALQKMEGFLAQLPAERVFHTYGDEPRPEIHARRVARTTGNLELAVRYLRAKLYSIALVEAIAEETGGDVPLDYFMGGLKTSTENKRIEQFLPHFKSRKDLDPPLHRLLAEGRASESSFDTKASPLGVFLHESVGEGTMMKGVQAARRWWGGAGTAAEFLASQPPQPVAAIARAAGNIIDTRRDRLFALAERLER